ncbi:MAG: exodeoxyribonuclease VII large subunit, partial [Deltaproteobacteria bacterium]|nr:exodeoxyribonuclease VII large subunit [Deltaproteobacteria bacterium]MBW2535548.1 exodeoxyribonuclease VII large subunit [Deltaproteobacteria bacterium]
MWSVAELDRGLKRMLESNTAGVHVRGEVSGLHRAASGHAYFTLKDEAEDAVIDAVMYRTAPAAAKKALQEGESVVLVGRVTVYPPRGRMQLVASDVLQTARGALLEALERLKRQLDAEGLFDEERKKPLPPDPRTIAVLTSRDGAAIHDVIQVAFQRGPVRILLVPTPVQGAGAASRIAAAIATADRLPGVDALVVTRGGGSLEDLAAYNDEQVVRAIAAATRPVVSAVGHEVDLSLSDLAADARAATPSQAAEILVPSEQQRREGLEHLERRLVRAVRHGLARASERLTRLRHGLGEPQRRLLEQGQRFDDLLARLERTTRRQAR